MADRLSPWRIGWTKLDSCPSKPNNIQIAPSGAVLVRNDETIHIVNLAYGIAPFLKPDGSFVHHRNAARKTDIFQTCIYIEHMPHQNKQGRLDKFGKPDKMTYDFRFLDAQWAPLEIGPYQSPIFATLTTRRTLQIWFAPENQFKGPWECLTSLSNLDEMNEYVRDVPFSSFTWLSLTDKCIEEESCYLMATSTDEPRVIIWKFYKDKAILNNIRIEVILDEIISVKTQEETEINLKSIYLLCSTSFEDKDHQSKNFITAFTRNGISQLIFNERDGTLQVDSLWKDEEEDTSRALFSSKYVTHAEWQKRDLFVCTSGEIFKFQYTPPSANDYPRNGKLVFLDNSGDVQTTNIQPIIGLQHDSHPTSLTIFLKDGTIYRKEGKFERTKKRQALKPVGELEAPVEEVADLQRQVERARGIYACKTDGFGLAYLCLDMNDLHAWAFYPRLSSSLEIALLEGPDEENDLKRAEEILLNIIENEGLMDEAIDVQQESISIKLRQYLLMFYNQSSRKNEILSVFRRILKELLAGTRLRNGFQLSCWLVGECESRKSQALPEAIELHASFRIRLALLNIEERINKTLILLQNGTFNLRSDPMSEVHCMVLASIAYCIVNKLGGSIELIKTFLSKFKTREMQVKIFRDWNQKIEANVVGGSEGIDVGERCPICDTPVMVLTGLDQQKKSSKPSINTNNYPFEAKCKEGHEWKRCSTSFGLINNIQSLACIFCSQHSILLKNSKNELQKTFIQDSFRCSLCKGTQVVI